MQRAASSPSLDGESAAQPLVTSASPDLSVSSTVEKMLRETFDMSKTLLSKFEFMEARLIKKIDERFERFEARIFDAERRADKVEADLKAARSACREKDQRIKCLSEEVCELRDAISDREQYQRKENVRITGLPEGDGETIEECEEIVQKFLKEELKIDRNIDISIAHRLGKRREGHPRPIICRLVRRMDKGIILSGRRTLREARSSVFLSEDLTQENIRLIKHLRDNPRVKKVWTVNCKVTVLGTNGQKLFNVTPYTDVDALFDSFNRR